MKPLTIILIRVLAVYFIAQSFWWGMPVIFSSGGWESIAAEDVITVAKYMGAPVVVGVILWFSAPAIASRATLEEKAPQIPNEQDLVGAGTFLIGIYWAVHAITNFVTIYTLNGSIHYGSVASLIIATLLILGSHFISVIFTKLRKY